MSDNPARISTDAHVNNAIPSATNTATGGLSDDELSAVNGGWGIVSTIPRPLGKERQAGMLDLKADMHKNNTND